nr:hypothetical protein [Ectothiorhodospira haloalkaliphila]
MVTEAERKSVSRETTFERDLHPRHDRAELTGILVALCERVAADLQALGVRGRTVGIKPLEPDRLLPLRLPMPIVFVSVRGSPGPRQVCLTL